MICSKEARSLGSLPLVGALFKFIRWTKLDVLAYDSIPVPFELAGYNQLGKTVPGEGF